MLRNFVFCKFLSGTADRYLHSEEVSMAPVAAFQVKGSKPAKLLELFAASEDEAEPTVLVEEADQLQEKGNEAASSGNWSLAIRNWDEALSQKPDNPHILHEQKAQVFLELGDPWRAIQSATVATQLQPEWSEGHLTLARAQLHFGEPELALQSMEMVLRLQPENADAAKEINTIRMLVMQRRGKEHHACSSDVKNCQKRLKVVSQSQAGVQHL